MNKEDEPLDTERMFELFPTMVTKIIGVIISEPRSKEASAATVAALAHVLVIVACKLVGRSNAVDIVATALSRGFEAANEHRKDLPP